MDSRILVLKGVTDSDLELLVIAVTCFNNGADLIVPFDQYDELVEAVGTKYHVYVLDYGLLV